MEDNKRDFSDFFKSDDDRRQERERKSDNGDNATSEPKNSYYYSYGPYKSSDDGDSANRASTSASDSQGVSNVEVSAPRPVRPISYGNDNGSSGQKGSWQFEKKRRSSVGSIFAAFMAGAIVIGSLMFAADKMNLFTGHPGYTAAPSSSNSQPASTSGGSGGGVKTTALDLDRPGNIAEITKKASPAVVLIKTYKKQKASRSQGNPFFDDPFFRQFFGDGYGQQQAPQNQGGQDSGALQEYGEGSGFIYKDSGYILTNEHVVDGADQVQVTVEGVSKPYTAKVLGSSFDYDLAVLKIEGDKPFPTIPIGNADNMDAGDWVIAIGNPYGFEHTVTVGVLSAKERDIPIQDEQGQRNYKHLLQTDASINPGNSGGPLINLDGQVIGINTAVSSQAQGIGFAIPTTTVNTLLDKLESGAKIPKEPSPFIGVTLQDIDKSWVKDLKLDNTEGALIASVDRGTPAFNAGIRQYDVIVKMNGEKVANSKDLQDKVAATKVGDKVTFTVMRNGQSMDVTVTVGDRNASDTNAG